jgi:hypothetical protein
MPGGWFGHSVAGTVSAHEASSIVQPKALRGSDVQCLRRLLQWPEQNYGDWLQVSPGGRQAVATPGDRAVSQNPKANAATDAATVPAGRRW